MKTSKSKSRSTFTQPISVRAGTAAMSLQEIADRQGCSLQAIQQVHARALRKLKEAIAREASVSKMDAEEWLFGE